MTFDLGLMCYIDQLAPDNYTLLSAWPITAGGSVEIGTVAPVLW